MLTWLVKTLRPFVWLLAGQIPNIKFGMFYRLDSITNSDAEFSLRVLMLAHSSTLAPHLGNTISVGRRVELPPILTLSHANVTVVYI